MRILTAAQMRDVDRQTTERLGIPGLQLMEAAGEQVVSELDRRFPGLDSKRVVILCGRGNNGGDGFVVARLLVARGLVPEVYLLARTSDVAGDAGVNLERFFASGGRVIEVPTVEVWDSIHPGFETADIVVDALLGTGSSRAAGGLYARAIESLNRSGQPFVVSIDLPSGVNTDTGDLPGPCVRADLTVTFSALKPALVFPPARVYAGEVVVVSIGNPDNLLNTKEHWLHATDPSWLRRGARTRSDDTNKGSFGKVLVVAGSAGKSGAASMAGAASLRAGAGLVTVLTASDVVSVVSSYMPEVMVEPLPVEDDEFRTHLRSIVPGKDVVAAGPGLSIPVAGAIVDFLIRDFDVPLVLDADALDGLPSTLRECPLSSDRLVVVTPHPGEMARMLSRPISDIVADRVGVARRFSQKFGVITVLKGFRSIVAFPSGDVYVNLTGNPGMATAGCGDVLTGMMAAILAQAHLGRVEDRVLLAVHLHGRAGDLAATALSQEAMVATDILRFLPECWREFWSIDIDHA